MSYDDPPEPTDEDIQEYHTAQNATPGVLRIEGLTRADVHATILGVLRGDYDLHEQINKAIKEAVEERVSEVAEAAIAQRVEAAIDEAIAEGFPIYNKWNGSIEKRTTLREQIDELLTLKDRDNYRAERNGTIPEQAIRRAVESVFDKHLTDVIASAKKAVQEQVDAIVKAKLGEALKSALGLR